MKQTINFYSLLLFFLLSVSIASAQKGEMSAGIKTGYSYEMEETLNPFNSSGYTGFGIGVHFQYNLSDHIGIIPSVDYFSLKYDSQVPGSDYSHSMTRFNYNLDFCYLIGVGSEFSLYPLLGMKIDSDQTFGINYGIGSKYKLSDNIDLFVNLRGELLLYDEGYNLFFISPGIAFKF